MGYWEIGKNDTTSLFPERHDHLSSHVLLQNFLFLTGVMKTTLRQQQYKDG
jgi:hypothetical protein